MGGTKPLLKIPVDDTKFNSFLEKFEKYQEQLAKTPSAWAQVSKENAAVSKQFERMAAALMAQNELAHEAAQNENKRQQHLKRSAGYWEQISHYSNVAASNALKISTSLLKWGSLIGAGLLGGSLFGLEKLGEATSRERQSAIGLGLTIGQQKSFETYFSRFVNPSAFLGAVNTAVTDVTQQGPLATLGVNPKGTTEQVALATIQALHDLAVRTPVERLGTAITGYNIGSLIDEEGLRRLKDDETYQGIFARYQKGATAFNIDKDTAAKWTEFNTNLNAAGEKIFKVFVNGLGPLTEPINQLSDSLVNLLNDALKEDGPVTHGINRIKGWITDFDEALKDDSFGTNFDKFLKDIDELETKFADWVDKLNHPGSALFHAVASDFKGSMGLHWEGLKALGSLVGDAADDLIGSHSRHELMAKADAEYGLPPGATEALFGNESSFGRRTINGEVNPFGLTQDDRKGVDVSDFDQSLARAAKVLSRHIQHFGGDVAAGFLAYNEGEAGARATMKNNPDWRNTVPYVNGKNGSGVNVNFTITPALGDSPQVAASQIGAAGPVYFGNAGYGGGGN